MNQLDILYRAFLDYRKSTLEDDSCVKMRHAIMRAAADRDKVESQRSICTIEEDWVCAIEKGLPFVEKAIREERQFIRQRGEVVPIEKVRRVSHASVSHLARHSDMITRMPEEGEDLIPDELYMVENLTNYAVYENRFLYMLLCYLRDFIDLRYNKIIELGNTYKASMTMAKTVTIGKRTITYNTQFSDEYRNDPLSSLSQESRDMIRRIEDMQSVVATLLATPLMRELAHVPMLKPPITRTNALRMDNSLRKSLALYDYVSAYDKDGYTVEVIRKTFSPLPEIMADDFSETISLTSFLVYEYSNELKGSLKEAYTREETRRRDEEAAAHRQKLTALRKKITDEGLSPEEYMLQLEERNRYLESLRTELDHAHEQLRIMTEEKARMEKTIHELEITVKVHDEEMLLQEAKHEEAIAEIKAHHQEELEKARTELLGDMAGMQDEHEKALDECNRRREADLAAAEERHASEVDALNKRYDDDTAALNEKYDDRVQSYEDSIADMKYEYEEQITVLGERACNAENALDTLREKHVLQSAELRALRHMRGTDTNEEDFTSEERFEELVEELAALDAFIGAHWKKAKKRIRHRYLWEEEES